MSDIVERIYELLLAKAKSKREAIERATMKPLQCADINSALEYGRIQGIEMAAEVMKEPQFSMINNEFDALRSRLEQAEKERDELKVDNDRLSDENSDLRCEPWPEWATSVLNVVRSCSGYDGYDDATDGVNLPAELEDCFSELEREYAVAIQRAESAEKALAVARNSALKEAARIVEDAPLAHSNTEIASAIRAKVTP